MKRYGRASLAAPNSSKTLEFVSADSLGRASAAHFDLGAIGTPQRRHVVGHLRRGCVNILKGTENSRVYSHLAHHLLDRGWSVRGFRSGRLLLLKRREQLCADTAR